MVRVGKGLLGRPPPLRKEDALFLDFDGTLVEFADDPTGVRVNPALRRAVESAAARLSGALALISGRPIEQIDRCFAPARLPVAGLHGLERRASDGTRFKAQPAPALRAAARRLRTRANRRPPLMGHLCAPAPIRCVLSAIRTGAQRPCRGLGNADWPSAVAAHIRHAACGCDCRRARVRRAGCHIEHHRRAAARGGSRGRIGSHPAPASCHARSAASERGIPARRA